MSFLGIGFAGGFAVPYAGSYATPARTFGVLFNAGVARRTGKSVIAYVGAGLDAQIASFDTNGAAVNADSGALVSAVPLATQHGLPLNFGPGQGRWTPTDLMRLRVEIYDPMDAAAFSNIHVALMRVTNDPNQTGPVDSFTVDYEPGLGTSVNATPPPVGDVVIGIHNRGAGDSGAQLFSLRLVYDHSLVWGR